MSGGSDGDWTNQNGSASFGTGDGAGQNSPKRRDFLSRAVTEKNTGCPNS
jgi:hypothetical protein